MFDRGQAGERPLVDGQPAEVIPLTDRGFQFGDGLFETIAVVDGAPCLWRQHLERLLLGCECLALPPPDPASLAAEAAGLCAGRDRAVLKVYWTAGDSPRGYRRATPLRPRRILQLADWAPTGGHEWTLVRCRHRLSSNPALARIKHMNRLDQVVARAEWADRPGTEGLMADRLDRPVCGVMSNLFVQHGGELVTPPLDEAGVAGVVRQLVIDRAAAGGSPVTIRPLAWRELATADALFVSNSLLGIARAGRFEDRVFSAAVEAHPAIADAAARCHRPERDFAAC